MRHHWSSKRQASWPKKAPRTDSLLDYTEQSAMFSDTWIVLSITTSGMGHILHKSKFTIVKSILSNAFRNIPWVLEIIKEHQFILAKTLWILLEGILKKNDPARWDLLSHQWDQLAQKKRVFISYCLRRSKFGLYKIQDYFPVLTRQALKMQTHTVSTEWRKPKTPHEACVVVYATWNSKTPFLRTQKTDRTTATAMVR